MFRWGVGAFCVFAGAVFLAINSIILWRGAAKWASEDVEWWAFGLAAALVPWVVGVMPSIMADSWKPLLRTSWFTVQRPSITVAVVWVAFIAYNIVGGSGAIGFNRLDLMAKREHGADVLAGLKAQRLAKLQELSGIPTVRPVEAIELEADALRQRKEYKNSGNCERPKAADQRKLCETILKLEAEGASSAKGERIRHDIAALDEKIAESSPAIVTGSIDPQAEIIHDVTQLDREVIKRWLPAATPIILEIGAATMWHFGFLILGLGLGAAPARKEADPQPAGYIPSPDAIKGAPELPLGEITAQAKLANWFFRECARRVPGGALTEEEWYHHYTEICRASAAAPMPVDSFRRVAARFVPTISFLDGQYRYFEVLPVIPEGAK